MKMDKQQIAVIGVIGLVFIFIIVYGVSAFGGDKETNHREKFEAPEIVKNDLKDDYNKRVRKVLRTEPEKPKDPVLLNPFETEDLEQEKDSVSVETEPVLSEPARLEQEPVTQTPVKRKPVRASKYVKVKPKRQQAAGEIEIEAGNKETQQLEPMPEPEPAKPMVTKQRFSVKSGSQSIDNTLKASVYGQQKLYDNTLLKIRLLAPLTLDNGIVIPRNTFVSGVARISNERVNVTIKTIAYRNKIYPVKFTVCDANDGLPGIYIGGGAVNDVADKTSSTLTEQAIGLSSMSVIQNVGQEVKKWSRKKGCTILDEHKLFLIK